MAPVPTKPNIIFVMGGPGSGKGTQCAKLMEALPNSCHLSTGDLLRAEKATGSDLGKQLDAIMSSGGLVSDDIVLRLLRQAIEEKSKAGCQFILLDGYPRALSQADEFEKEVAACDLCIYFELSDAVMTERIMERGKTSGRADDNAETIALRLNTFKNETLPIIEKYKNSNHLLSIDASRSIDAIFPDALAAVKNKFSL